MTEPRPDRQHSPARALLLLLAALTLCLGAAGCRCGGEKKAPGKRTGPAVVVVDPDEEEAAEPLAEKEPNNSREAAQDLSAGELVAGDLAEGAKDSDWYRVSVAEEAQVLRATLSGVPELDLTLEAYSAAGKRLMRVDNNREGGGEVLVNLSPDKGVTFLRVSERKGRSAPGRYRIGYSLRPREEGEEVEPNWKAALATPLDLDAEATGYLGWPTDNDWYRVELQDGDPNTRLRLEFDGLDGVAAHLSLRDGAGKQIQGRWSRRGEALVLANLAPAAGTTLLHAVVRCHKDTNVENRYFLRILARLPAGPCEAEPNDEPAQATALPLGRPMEGALSHGRDRDIFAVAVERPTLAEVQATPPLGVDLAVALLDAQGEVLLEVNDGGARQPEQLAGVPLRPPAALLRVRALPGSDTVLGGAYHISVRQSPGAWLEREPNDAAAAATRVPDGVAEVLGHLLPGSSDVDHLTFAAVGEVGLHLSVRSAGGDPLRAELLDAEGRAVASGRGEGGNALRLAAEGAAPGALYTLRVRAGGEQKKPLSGYTVTRQGAAP